MKNKNNQLIRTKQDLRDAIGDCLFEANVNAAIMFGGFMVIVLLSVLVYKLIVG
jgi:hypothetical protein